jgi:hypothetical protein
MLKLFPMALQMKVWTKSEDFDQQQPSNSDFVSVMPWHDPGLPTRFDCSATPWLGRTKSILSPGVFFLPSCFGDKIHKAKNHEKPLGYHGI